MSGALLSFDEFEAVAKDDPFYKNLSNEQPKAGAFECFVSADPGNKAEKWPFEKLEPALKPAPAFNAAMLPEAFAGFVDDAAERMQVAPDYMAVALMVSLSSVVGRRVAVYPKQKDDWLVVPNLWGGIIGNPSVKKSPSLEEGAKAVESLERQAKQDYMAAEKFYAIEEKILKLRERQDMADAKTALAGEGGTEAAARKILQDSHRTLEKPIRRRYKTNSTTVEKLGELLAENPRGILIIRDELSGFMAEMDKQGHEADRAFYLEAWTGKGSFTYDRIGRGTVDIPAVCVSVLGGTQPDKIKPLVGQAIKGGVGNDGFIQRFQLLVYPDHKRETYIDRLPSKMAENRMREVFDRLAGLDDGDQIRLRFSDEAQACFIQWFESLNEKLSDPDIHPAIESHLSKYKSMVPSIALLVHLADCGDAALGSPVSKKAILKALAWSEYLEGHMHRIYGLAESIDHENALTIARRLGGKLGMVFTLRDVKQCGWKGIGRDNDTAQAAINILLEHGYIREAFRTTDGRPTVDYVVNAAVVGCHG